MLTFALKNFRMESTLQKEATLEQAIDLGLRADEFEMI
jgi:hypothetical protein